MALIDCEILELVAPRSLQVKHETIDTASLKDGQIAARTVASVLSPGTETAAYRGDPPLRPMKVYPRLQGYCNVAEVIACGPGVKDIRPGDRILTGQSHRTAFACDRDKVLAVVPPTLEPALAATTYLFELGYNAVRKVRVEPGRHIAVIGLGTLGLTAAAMAHYHGATVYAVSNQAIAAERAHAFGISRCFQRTATAAHDLRSTCPDSRGVDAVITTTNTWEDWQLALELPGKHGTIGVLGFPGRGLGPPPFNPLNSARFYDQQLAIIACGMDPATMPSPSGETRLQTHCAFLLRLIAEGRLPARELISATADWRQLGALYERMLAGEADFVTAALSWK